MQPGSEGRDFSLHEEQERFAALPLGEQQSVVEQAQESAALIKSFKKKKGVADYSTAARLAEIESDRENPEHYQFTELGETDLEFCKKCERDAGAKEGIVGDGSPITKECDCDTSSWEKAFLRELFTPGNLSHVFRSEQAVEDLLNKEQATLDFQDGGYWDEQASSLHCADMNGENGFYNSDMFGVNRHVMLNDVHGLHAFVIFNERLNERMRGEHVISDDELLDLIQKVKEYETLKNAMIREHPSYRATKEWKNLKNEVNEKLAERRTALLQTVTGYLRISPKLDTSDLLQASETNPLFAMYFLRIVNKKNKGIITDDEARQRLQSLKGALSRGTVPVDHGIRMMGIDDDGVLRTLPIRLSEIKYIGDLKSKNKVVLVHVEAKHP